MKILLTNDDGVSAIGLWHLWNALHTDHDVTVIAPKCEQSGVSHGFTHLRPLNLEAVPQGPGPNAWCVDGTPADCVKLGVTHLLVPRPDVVISGINPSDNSGIARFYSGTVGGAQEAALWGIASVAISVSIPEEPHFRAAALFLATHINPLAALHRENKIFLNINFPGIPLEEIRGVRVTRQGCAMFQDYYQKKEDGQGKHCFWIYGAKNPAKFEPGSDDQAINEGYIAVTPLKLDTTCDHTYHFLREKGPWKEINR